MKTNRRDFLKGMAAVPFGVILQLEQKVILQQNWKGYRTIISLP